MNTIVRDGRLHTVDKNGVTTRIPLSMDEAKSMKMERRLPEGGEDMLQSADVKKTSDMQLD